MLEKGVSVSEEEMEEIKRKEDEAEEILKEKAKKKVSPHLQDAEDFEQPVEIARTKIIDDKYVIDREFRILIIEYRIGNVDEDGDLVDVERETAVYRDEEYDAKIKELFNDEKLFFAKGRNQGKERMNQKVQQVKARLAKDKK